MAVNISKLPTLRAGSVGEAVVWAKEGIKAYSGSGNTTRIYGPFFVGPVKEFKRKTNCGDQGATGVIGPATWKCLLKYIPSATRAKMPQIALIPNIGPVQVGGKSLLDHDLTHATSGIPLYPAFDAAFGAGVRLIAPENMVVDKKLTSSSPGSAFYCSGESTLDYWFAHLDRAHPLGTRFKKGDFIGKTIPTSAGGGPHAHVGVNGEAILGAGKQFAHHLNYTHGAPTIRTQLQVFYSL